MDAYLSILQSLSMFRFRPNYLISAIVLVIVEVLIALYMDDAVIRPYVGDLLVVILIYCFMRTFLNYSAWQLAIASLLFSYFVEILQYFKIVEVLGLEKFALARILIGTYFTWVDMLAYTAGFIIIILVERFLGHAKPVTDRQ
ncbi:MAG: hypothetical protein JWQ27_2127 [Ferruginibacter sp.]|nr:hypothetical protein [Ferruginibacter sp.]